jgi:hypothetical protein
MSLWLERLNEMSHYEALMDEAGRERLAHQAARDTGTHKNFWCCAMRRLGSLLYDWGKHLQERYGYT